MPNPKRIVSCFKNNIVSCFKNNSPEFCYKSRELTLCTSMEDSTFDGSSLKDAASHYRIGPAVSSRTRLATVKMIYDAVVRLLNELDTVFHISTKMLNIKILQAKLFTEKVGEVLGVLEMEGTPTFSDQLVGEILSLALPAEDFVNRHWLPTVQSNVQNAGSTCSILEEKLIRDRIGLVENKLEKFLDETDLYNVWDDLRSNLVLLPTREAVRDLLQASQQLKKAINFFHQVTTELAVLYQYLEFLHRFFKTLQDDYSHKLFLDIWYAVKKALYAIDFPKYLKSSFLKFVEASSGYPTGSNYEMYIFIEETVKEFFDGNKGRHLILLETLGKLHSFTGELDVFCKKLGREDLQFQNASLSI